jgi:hypothetical protein
MLGRLGPQLKTLASFLAGTPALACHDGFEGRFPA